MQHNDLSRVNQVIGIAITGPSLPCNWFSPLLSSQHIPWQDCMLMTFFTCFLAMCQWLGIRLPTGEDLFANDSAVLGFS